MNRKQALNLADWHDHCAGPRARRLAAPWTRYAAAAPYERIAEDWAVYLANHWHAVPHAGLAWTELARRLPGLWPPCHATLGDDGATGTWIWTGPMGEVALWFGCDAVAWRVEGPDGVMGGSVVAPVSSQVLVAALKSWVPGPVVDDALMAPALRSAGYRLEGAPNGS